MISIKQFFQSFWTKKVSDNWRKVGGVGLKDSEAFQTFFKSELYVEGTLLRNIKNIGRWYYSM